jgi:hypothetical protein
MHSADECQRLLREAVRTKDQRKLTRLVLVEDASLAWGAIMSVLSEKDHKWVIDALCAENQRDKGM